MSTREPYVWATAVVVAWLLVVTLIVLAADGADPTIEAGTAVMLLPLATFLSGGVAGVRGRDKHWPTRSGVVTGLLVGLAYLVLVLGRVELEALYLVPLITFVAAVVSWLCCAGGWLLGSVVRHGLGLGDSRHQDEGFL